MQSDTQPTKLSSRDQRIISEISLRLGQLHRRRPSAVERGLLAYSTFFWGSFGCPVYLGFEFFREARQVLHLLVALQVPQVRVICFAARDSMIAARWERLLGWPRRDMTYRRPPNSASPAARKWLGVDALFSAVVGEADGVGFKASKGFGILMRYATRWVVLQQQLQANSQQQVPRQVQEDPDEQI
jgi:hypothetical protein